MNRKIATVMCITGCIGMVLTGCQKTPEKKSVVQKSTSAMLDKEKENKDTLKNVSSALDGEMKNAKEDYLKQAKVEVKDASKISVYQTKDVTFTQDQADQFLKTVSEGQELYKIDDSWSKQQYKEAIKMLKEEIAANKCGDEIYEDTDKTYNETLEEYKKAYEKAPDGDSKERASRKFVKTKDNGESIYGYIKKSDGTKRVIRVSNNNYLASGLNPTQMCFADLHGKSATFLDYGVIEDKKNAVKKNVKLSKEEAVAKADEMIKNLGIKDFSWTGHCLLVCEDSAISTENKKKNGKLEVSCGYSLVFTRQLNGVNMAIPDDMKDMVCPLKLGSGAKDGSDSEEALEMDSDYTKKLDYEAINLVVNDKGVVMFNYTAPFKVEKTVIDDTHILSAKDLIEAAATYVSNTMTDETGGMSYTVKKVCLGYQRIQEEGSDDTTLLVPVWNFIGDSKYKGEYTDSDGKEVSMENITENTALWTLNAIDGSNVDTKNSLG